MISNSVLTSYVWTAGEFHTWISSRAIGSLIMGVCVCATGTLSVHSDYCQTVCDLQLNMSKYFALFTF